MATYAEYMSLIGDDRIVSLMNADPLAVPKTLEASIYTNVPGTPQDGNRKIVAMILVPLETAGESDVADQTLTLKVKVPEGSLSAPGLQKFDASTPELNYYPQAKVHAQNVSAVIKATSATPIIGSEDVNAQTIDIEITMNTNIPLQPKKPVYALFLIEVDWSHSVIN